MLMTALPCAPRHGCIRGAEVRGATPRWRGGGRARARREETLHRVWGRMTCTGRAPSPRRRMTRMPHCRRRPPIGWCRLGSGLSSTSQSSSPRRWCSQVSCACKGTCGSLERAASTRAATTMSGVDINSDVRGGTRRCRAKIDAGMNEPQQEKHGGELRGRGVQRRGICSGIRL